MRPLPRKKEGDFLGAGHVNALSAGVEKANQMVSGSYIRGDSTTGAISGLPPVFIRPLVVTQIGYDTDLTVGMFTAKLCYWDNDEKQWMADDTQAAYPLNDVLDPHGFLPYDVLQAYYDPQAVAYVPIGPKRRRQVVLLTDCYAAVDHLTDPSYCEGYVIRRNPTTGEFETTNRRVTIANRFEDISFDRKQYAKIEFIDREWQFYAANCPSGSSSSESSDELVSE